MGIAFPECRLGTVKSIVQFNQRIAPAGTRFYYASIEDLGEHGIEVFETFLLDETEC